jgi:excisionase family DNA binding protein
VLKEGIIVPQQHDALRKYKLQQINQHDAADYPDTANMRTQTQHKLLTIQEAAQTLNLSVWTLRSWAYAGRISSHKLGKRLMVSQEELDRILAETERPRLKVR